jgi:hypothetical protein
LVFHDENFDRKDDSEPHDVRDWLTMEPAVRSRNHGLEGQDSVVESPQLAPLLLDHRALSRSEPNTLIHDLDERRGSIHRAASLTPAAMRPPAASGLGGFRHLDLLDERSARLKPAARRHRRNNRRELAIGLLNLS